MVTGEQHERFYEFLSASLGRKYAAMPGRKTIAHLDGDRIKAVVLFSNITHRSCDLTIATDGGRDWGSRQFISAVFGYAFTQLGHQRVSVTVCEHNTASIDMVLRLGFQFEGVKRREYDTGDGYLFSMLRHECRWIGEKK